MTDKHPTQAGTELPPKPKEPDPDECCGRGCDPCIYDYYQRALEKWQKKVALLTSVNNDKDS